MQTLRDGYGVVTENKINAAPSIITVQSRLNPIKLSSFLHAAWALFFMNILFLNRHAMKNASGGLPEFLAGLSTALTARGHQTYLYHENLESNILTEPEPSIGTLTAFSGPFPAPAGGCHANNCNRSWHSAKNQKIDLIHAQGVYRSGWVARALGRATGLPWLVTSHSDILSSHSHRLKRKKILRRCQQILADATATTHLTPATAENCPRAVGDPWKKLDHPQWHWFIPYAYISCIPRKKLYTGHRAGLCLKKDLIF